MFSFFDYAFMRYAIMAATLVAIMASSVGYFLVLRGQSFAGHALSHISFTGAAGASLLGIAPLTGMVVMTLAAGLAMGTLGEKMLGRDAAIGMILSVALALGLLFSRLNTSNTLALSAMLFGNVLAVNLSTLFALLILFFICIVPLAIISRPLLLASIQPELAESKGVQSRFLSAIFMCVVSLAVASSAQIVGVLLVFTLLIAPAASAFNLALRIKTGILLSIIFGVIQAWAGLLIAYISDWPVSFCITVSGAVIFLISLLIKRMR